MMNKLIEWLKWQIAAKEMQELENWRIEWHEHRRWFAEKNYRDCEESIAQKAAKYGYNAGLEAAKLAVLGTEIVYEVNSQGDYDHDAVKTKWNTMEAIEQLKEQK
jgi:hypothetical protein